MKDELLHGGCLISSLGHFWISNFKPGAGSFGLFHVSSPCSPISVFRQGSDAQAGIVGVSPDPCGSLPPQETPAITFIITPISPH